MKTVIKISTNSLNNIVLLAKASALVASVAAFVFLSYLDMTRTASLPVVKEEIVQPLS